MFTTLAALPAPVALAVAPVVAVVVVLACRRLCGERGLRFAGPCAVAGAFVLADALTSGMQHWLPTRNWQWTLHVAVLAAVLGPIAAAPGLTRSERWLLYATGAVIAACLLVPRWAKPEQAAWWIPLAAGGIFLLAALQEPLSGRVSGVALTGAWAISALCLAGLIAVEFSLSWAQVAGLVGLALTGAAFGLGFAPAESATRALVATQALVVGGWAFISCVEPSRPAYVLLAPPALPLLLWLLGLGPLGRLGARGQTIVGLLLVGLAAAGYAAWAVIRSGILEAAPL
ncbi:MAG: hypothetical protein KF774_10690 [Planctomyces sp.]|nr:hypothetical protein [Planctomyces sp.]